MSGRNHAGAALVFVSVLMTASGCSAAPAPAAGPGSGPGQDRVRAISADTECVAEFLYLNECGGREEKLIAWNEGEDFPSLGIGHLIWYPLGRADRFSQKFPELLDFLEKRGEAPPEWVRVLPERAAPWRTRAEFEADRDSARVRELRSFLLRTRKPQADFIIERLNGLLPILVREAAPQRKAAVADAFRSLMASERGQIALVDYVNFKGEGLSRSERYAGQGWGLLQVLEEMAADGIGGGSELERFALAAIRTLNRRVANSPPERGEARWIPGWENRIRRYLTWKCEPSN